MTDNRAQMTSTTETLSIVAIDRLETLKPWRESWDRLVFSSSTCRPTSSYSWVVSYLEHCVPDNDQWICLLAANGETLLGVLPLIITPTSRLGKRLWKLQTPNDLETASVEIAARAKWYPRLMQTFFTEVTRRYPGWSEASFVRVPVSSPVLTLEATTKLNLTLVPDLNGWGSYLEVTGDFAAYTKSFGKNFRRNLKKAERKLSALSNIRAEILKDAEIQDRHLDEFLRLEASGWKGRKGTAIRDTQSKVAFYRSLIRRLREGNHLEWHFLRKGDEAIAGQFAIKTGCRLTIPKIAYNEEYAHCAPGNRLFLHMLEDVFARDDIEEVDCLTDMAWHANWKMKRREYYDIRIFPNRLIPQIFGAWPLQAKHLIRRIPGIRQVKRLLVNPQREPSDE